MKIHQNARHWATKKALTTPGLGYVATAGLVRLHTNVFLGKAEPGREDERKDHLDDFFEGTVDTYLAALEAGFDEAGAREITHIQANFDFYNHGWTEMMEFPADEVEAHYERYERFFEHHNITIDDPLGDFRSGDIADAPSTLEKLDNPEHPHAEGGFADDVYVEDDDGEIHRGGAEEPGADDVDVGTAVGVGGSGDSSDERSA